MSYIKFLDKKISKRDKIIRKECKRILPNKLYGTVIYRFIKNDDGSILMHGDTVYYKFGLKTTRLKFKYDNDELIECLFYYNNKNKIKYAIKWSRVRIYYCFSVLGHMTKSVSVTKFNTKNVMDDKINRIEFIRNNYMRDFRRILYYKK